MDGLKGIGGTPYAGSSMVGATVKHTPIVHVKYEELTKALESLRGEVDMMDEQLGHVSTPQTPSDVSESHKSPGEPPQHHSPMVHNLHVATAQVNSLAFRLQAMRCNLEI